MIGGGLVTIDANTAGTLATASVTFNATGTLNFDNTGYATAALTKSIPGALTFSGGEGTLLLTLTAPQNETLIFGSLGARA